MKPPVLSLKQFMVRQEVLKLYRQFFRTIKLIPDEDQRKDLQIWIRSDFKAYKDIDPNNEDQIKSLMYNGEKMLRELKQRSWPRPWLGVRDYNASSAKPHEFKDTSLVQKLILALGSSVMALSDPWRADMVAVNGEVTGTIALQRLHSKMKANPEGRMILSDKPFISTKTVDFEALKNLPPTTLGYQYAHYCEVYGISPDSRNKVEFIEDPELAYIMQRFRETHDLVHSVLDMPTNMVGEVAVKWVEALQTGIPMCVGGAILGPVRFTPKQVKEFNKLRPWAIKTGMESKPFINVYYEKRWEQDLNEFREEMNFRPYDSN